MRFAFIDVEKVHYPLTVLCRVMQVCRSGFYAWLNRPACSRVKQDGVLSVHIDAAFSAGRGTYGSPRVHAELSAKGVHTSKRRVERLMRTRGLCARRKRRFTRTTLSRHRLPIAPNLLGRDFTVEAPNRVWTTDLTYIWTLQGWLYLAVMLDLFSRRVVGWAFSASLDDSLAISALNMAIQTRRPPRGLIHHSDRGSQYCSKDYLAVLHANGIVRSMSRKADCWDNAVSESFFGTLKQELIFRCELQNRADAQTTIFEYLEVFYNPKRRHSTLGFLSPNDFEERNLVADSRM